MRKGQHFARAFKRAVAVEYLQSGEERKAMAKGTAGTLITSHSPCTTAEDGRCQSLAITVFSHHIFCKDSDFP